MDAWIDGWIPSFYHFRLMFVGAVVVVVVFVGCCCLCRLLLLLLLLVVPLLLDVFVYLAVGCYWFQLGQSRLVVGAGDLGGNSRNKYVECRRLAHRPTARSRPAT